MKQFLTIFILAIMFMFTANTVNAQNIYQNQTEAYIACRSFVEDGNNAYNAGYFSNAISYYERALQANMECNKKFISDKKLYRKIDDCNYAIQHNGKTRQEVRAENTTAILGAALLVGTVAAITSSHTSHHDVIVHHHHW